MPVVSGIVLEDGYVMPPPPSFGGVWRDHATLVMTKDASLPDYCVKCDAPAGGFRLRRRFSWHEPLLYLLVLVGWLVYFIVAIIVRKQATVYLGLCQEHHQRRRNWIAAGWALFAFTFLLMFVAFANYYPGIGLLSLLGIFGSLVWLIIATRVVNVKKIDDRYVWLTGVNANYLARFPSVQ